MVAPPVPGAISAPASIAREFDLRETEEKVRVRRRRRVLSGLADNLLFILVFALLGAVIFILYSLEGGRFDPEAGRGTMDFTLEALTIAWLVLLVAYIAYFVLKMFNILDRSKWVEVDEKAVRIGARRFPPDAGRFQVGGAARPAVPEPEPGLGAFRLFPARIYLFYEGGRRIDTTLRSRDLAVLLDVEDRLNRRLGAPRTV
ncbi:hypothetical protein E5163_02070 [Marinicauda algicola]|uniref:Uncharacterized protein n=1 Tax=Marinicauda algicola TaxID=2029849 RepID=A0A4S2H2X4_9PROT|nr:hypothetical protein [Marinicauda algicola]TGY89947.1 hypothetical protein E5163_02070 [Marinicauda algicola]